MSLVDQERVLHKQHPALAHTDYAGYTSAMRARSDELLVRVTAAEIMGHAHTILGARIRDWRQRYISRTVISQPRAYGDRIEILHHMLDLHDGFVVTEAGIRTMVTSVDQKLWQRIQSDLDCRHLLQSLDRRLLDAVAGLELAAGTISFTPGIVGKRNPDAPIIEAMLAISQALADRARFFAPPEKHPAAHANAR